MKNKKKIVSLTAVSLVLGSTMATANATGTLSPKLRDLAGITKEDLRSEHEAIKNSDYKTWKNIMDKISGGIDAGYLSEENFNIIVRAYKLKASGDTSGAVTLLENANIPRGIFLGGGIRNKADKTDNQPELDQAAVEETYKEKDYNKWLELMEPRGGKILEIINENNFSKFAEAKILQSEGKNEEAGLILHALGFPFYEKVQVD